MSSFLSELKRRNVFRVGVAYAIVAWLIMQVADTFFPALHLPDWTVTLIAVLLIIGFLLAIFLAWVYELTPEGIKVTTTEGPAQYHTRATGQRLNYFIMGVLALAVAFILIDNYVLDDETGTSTVASVSGNTSAISTAATESASLPPSVTTDTHVIRTSLNLGETHPYANSGIRGYVALSRDGRQLIYAVNSADGSQLYHRAMNQLTARPLPGTSNGFDMFFSPDGEWVGYFTPAPSGIRKIALVGGQPQELTDQGTLGNGAYWSSDGYIYFSSAEKLHRIPANGGTPEPVNIKSELSNWSHSRPYGLPDEKYLLLTVSQSQGNERDGNIALLNLETGESEILVNSAYNARYVPTGHIVFIRSATLWAVPFDISQLKINGTEVPVVNGIETTGNSGITPYAASDEGLLVYLPGEDITDTGSGNRFLVWVDRGGNETRINLRPGMYSMPRLSPDESQFALRKEDRGGVDLWTYDLKRGTLSRTTFNGNTTYPLWTLDSERLVHSFTIDYQGLSWVRADGTGQPEKLLDEPRLLVSTSFTPDGSHLIYNEYTTGDTDIYSMSMNEDRIEQPLLVTEFAESLAAISPNGRWIAYQANETGREEIYVRPFPDVGGGKWQISTEGGFEPYWRGDGKELFYRRGTNPVTIMAVPVKTDSHFQAEIPVTLFSGDYLTFTYTRLSYGVTADGQRFYMLKRSMEESSDNILSQLTSLVVVENWFEELKRLAPPAAK